MSAVRYWKTHVEVAARRATHTWAGPVGQPTVAAPLRFSLER